VAAKKNKAFELAVRLHRWSSWRDGVIGAKRPTLTLQQAMLLPLFELERRIKNWPVRQYNDEPPKIPGEPTGTAR